MGTHIQVIKLEELSTWGPGSHNSPVLLEVRSKPSKRRTQTPLTLASCLHHVLMSEALASFCQADADFDAGLEKHQGWAFLRQCLAVSGVGISS